MASVIVWQEPDQIVRMGWVGGLKMCAGGKMEISLFEFFVGDSALKLNLGTVAPKSHVMPDWDHLASHC